jgi:small subunit ribosomal protein S16
MVKLRLARAGAKKHPFYHVVVSDVRSSRDGRFIEQIGTYDPMTTPKGFAVNQDRLDYWLSVGAQPSASLKQLVLKHKKEDQAST